MSLSLKNREWKEFLFSKIFDIYSSSSGIDKNKLLLKEGNIPYITRTEKNNGIDLYLCEQNNRYKKDLSNTITIGLDTQTVFYQSCSFYTGQNIQILESEKLNKLIANFVIPLIKIQLEKFNWGGNGATLTRLKRSKLFLPVNSKSEPDFTFMEAYMLSQEKQKEEVLRKYLTKKKKELKRLIKVETINSKEWKEFLIQDFFDTKKGNQNKMADLKDGKMPLVSAKNGNNGLKGFVSKNIKMHYLKNTLTLNNDGDGGAGISYYQPFDYLLDSHVTALYPKDKLNKYSLLFISRCITKQRNKFGHGYSLTNNRLKAFKVMLPINKDQQPDYEYMENYMKQLELKKINSYLKYKAKEKVSK